MPEYKEQAIQKLMTLEIPDNDKLSATTRSTCLARVKSLLQ